MQGMILLHKYEKMLDITPKLKFMDQNLSARIDILKLTYENLPCFLTIGKIHEAF